MRPQSPSAQPCPNTSSAVKFDLKPNASASRARDAALPPSASEKPSWSSFSRIREKNRDCEGRLEKRTSPTDSVRDDHLRNTSESVTRNYVRTIPSWVRSAEEDDLISEPEQDYFLPNSPRSAFVAQHHYSLSATRTPGSEYGFGLTAPWNGSSSRRSRWISFAKPSIYPKEQWQGVEVGPNWLDTEVTDYSKPWLADHNEDDVEEGSGRYHAFRQKRKTWYKRMQQTILYNPMIPLVFRMTVFTFSAVAAALGASIHRESQIYRFTQGPSAVMAIIIDVVALVYILYITWDEYTGKPLGLRSAKAKLRVIFLDLFFIVFQSANLSLAFQTLSDPKQACRPGVRGTLSDTTDAGICAKQKALASVILIALIAWLNTFCVSILRLVERVERK